MLFLLSEQPPWSCHCFLLSHPSWASQAGAGAPAFSFPPEGKAEFWRLGRGLLAAFSPYSPAFALDYKKTVREKKGKKKKSKEQKAHRTYLNVMLPFLYFEACKASAENGSKASQGKPSKVSSAAVILRRRDRAVALPPNGTCL